MPAVPPLPLWRQPVTYGAVGATQADDFRRFPPTGYRTFEHRVRLGHGEERWRHAWTQTLSLGIQRRSGLRVELVESPAEVLDNSYVPVTFDDDGQPVLPASTSSGEQLYADTGERLVRAGDVALLWVGRGRASMRIPVRVIYLIDEPARRGFAYGTLPGHPESGEEAFVVEQRDDDSVWLTIRGFSRPSHPALWLAQPVLRLVQAFFTSRYLHALTGPLPASR